MPASSSPICSGEPVWTVWRREVNGSQFNLVARLTDARAGTGFCRNINPGETIETIGDISRKNSPVIQTITNEAEQESLDRKSTRLNSSHSQISYAVFCLKKTKQ